mmetsp:Transcript_42340/g.72304  ORF Transcript_42340/g.72304 Transcript_42340/m.72304 type:complete len:90 (+) Transcript_42340:281-550(+)
MLQVMNSEEIHVPVSHENESTPCIMDFNPSLTSSQKKQKLRQCPHSIMTMPSFVKLRDSNGDELSRYLWPFARFIPSHSTLQHKVLYTD